LTGGFRYETLSAFLKKDWAVKAPENEKGYRNEKISGLTTGKKK